MKGRKKKNEEEIVRHNQELSILNAISQAVNESIDLDEILNRSLDKIVEMTEVRSAGIYLLDEKKNKLIFVAHRGFSKTFLKEMRQFNLGERAVGRSTLSGESLFVEDYPSYTEALPVAIEEGLKSLAVIPLKSRKEVYGTLYIGRKDLVQFAPFDRNLYDSIGQIISNAMERTLLYTENIKRLEEQRVLYSITQEIASQLELKVILEKIVKCAIGILGAHSGAVALWDSRMQTYTIGFVHGVPESLVGKELAPSLSGIGGDVLKKKNPVIYNDYENHPNRLKELDSYRFKEVVGFPLIIRDMVIGVMVIGTANPEKHFHQREIDLLNAFAQQGAIAIGNAQLYEDSLSKIRQLATLSEVERRLSTNLDFDELLKNALELLHSHWGYALCGILLLDREKNELYIRQLIGKDFGEVKDLRFRVGIDGVIGRVAQTGNPFYVPDVSKEPRYISGLSEIRSEAAFPLKVRGHVVGVLNVESTKLYGFDEEDLKTLTSFANQVSVFMENAQLFSDLKETLSELKQAQDQIVQTEKLRAMGEMASGVAHDFNNVLAVILGNIQLLAHQLEQLKYDEIRDRLRIIEQASKDGAETVRRIQEFTGKRKDKEFVILSLNDLVQEVSIITEPRWKDQSQKKGIQIALTKELGDIPPILGNPSELREVFTNILFNAVDAMPEGGKITIITEPHSEGWVEMRISDTGTGMTEETKRKIFDPFFTTKGVTNSGLGMSVSYGIIKRHGGEILVESEPGKGTTFALHLPMGYGEEAKDLEIRAEKPVGLMRPARILVIDDEEAVRDILSRMLRTKGHQVEVAGDGEQGMEYFQKGSFDLVLTDLGMPRVSGWEVGRMVKEINSQIPVAMITGWGIELNREKMRESGIDFIVSKPFNYDQVVQLVSEAMELREKM